MHVFTRVSRGVNPFCDFFNTFSVWDSGVLIKTKINACKGRAGLVCFCVSNRDEKRILVMQKDIHPNYGEAAIKCACGHTLDTRSTVKEMHVNTCGACHPFFTGQSRFVDTEGRVERFQKRYASFKRDK